MNNDLAARRAKRLTPAGRELLTEIQRAMQENDHSAISAIMKRKNELPAVDRSEITELIRLLRHGAKVEGARPPVGENGKAFCTDLP